MNYFVHDYDRRKCKFEAANIRLFLNSKFFEGIAGRNIFVAIV